MITISAPTHDVDGVLQLRNVAAKSNLGTTTRRVERVPTLDGGAHITDLGFSDGDRTLEAELTNPTRDQAEKLLYLQKNYASLVIATIEGVFLGSLAQVNSAGGISIVFLVSDRLS